jgi:hypothetical protein
LSDIATVGDAPIPFPFATDIWLEVPRIEVEDIAPPLDSVRIPLTEALARFST